MSQSKVIVLSGPSGCGKSTYADELIDTGLDATYERISSDTIRGELYGDESVQVDHFRVFAEVDSRVESALLDGYAPVVDATNLRPRDRQSYIEAAQRHGVPCELHIFLVNLNDCIAGQESRERKVPNHVIERMFNAQMEDLKRSVGQFNAECFDVVKFVKR